MQTAANFVVLCNTLKSELASYSEVVGGPWWDVQTAANNYRALHPLKQTTDSDFA